MSNEYNVLIELMAKKEDEVRKLFSLLDECTVNLTNEDLKGHERYEVAMGVEFIILRIRVIVASELDNINGAITNLFDREIPTNIQIKMKKRQAQLISTTGRLNELREDLNSMQKMIYTYRQLPQ